MSEALFQQEQYNYQSIKQRPVDHLFTDTRVYPTVYCTVYVMPAENVCFNSSPPHYIDLNDAVCAFYEYIKPILKVVQITFATFPPTIVNFDQ